MGKLGGVITAKFHAAITPGACRMSEQCGATTVFWEWRVFCGVRISHPLVGDFWVECPHSVRGVDTLYMQNLHINATRPYRLCGGERSYADGESILLAYPLTGLMDQASTLPIK
jgi:hypothetical protein